MTTRKGDSGWWEMHTKLSGGDANLSIVKLKQKRRTFSRGFEEFTRLGQGYVAKLH